MLVHAHTEEWIHRASKRVESRTIFPEQPVATLASEAGRGRSDHTLVGRGSDTCAPMNATTMTMEAGSSSMAQAWRAAEPNAVRNERPYAPDDEELYPAIGCDDAEAVERVCDEPKEAACSVSEVRPLSSGGHVGMRSAMMVPSVCALGVERLFSHRGLVVLYREFSWFLKTCESWIFWGGKYELVEEGAVEREAGGVVECERLVLVRRSRDDDLHNSLVFELRSTCPYRTSVSP